MGLRSAQIEGHAACKWHPERIEEGACHPNPALVSVSWVTRISGGGVGWADHDAQCQRIAFVTHSTFSTEETQKKHQADLRAIQSCFPRSQNNLNSDSLSDTWLLTRS